MCFLLLYLSLFFSLSLRRHVFTEKNMYGLIQLQQNTCLFEPFSKIFFSFRTPVTFSFVLLSFSLYLPIYTFFAISLRSPTSLFRFTPPLATLPRANSSLAFKFRQRSPLRFLLLLFANTRRKRDQQVTYRVFEAIHTHASPFEMVEKYPTPFVVITLSSFSL